MRLADDKGELVELFRGHSFREAALARFPEIRSDVDDDDGIHIVMFALGALIMSAIAAGDRSRAESLLAFVDGLLDIPNLDPEIPNAMAISFVDPDEVQQSELGRSLWARVPDRLKRPLVDYFSAVRHPR